MKTRLIASDLDHTLMKNYFDLSDFSKEMLEIMMNRGVEFVPCSARTNWQIPVWLKENPRIRYYVCENGAFIVEGKDDKVIRSNVLNAAKVREILDRTASVNPYWTIFADSKLYSSQLILDHADALNITGDYLEHIKKERTFIENAEEIMDKDGFSKVHFITDDAVIKEKTYEVLTGLEDAFVTTSHIKNIEISHPDASKGAGIAYIQELLGISREETLVFGDNENDLSMFENADHSCAVENGTESCKQLANHRTLRSDEDGVAVFLKKWLEEGNL